MMNEKYKHLFPYELVPVGSKIVIYGAGDMGLDYLEQMQLTNYCEVLALADKNYEKYQSMSVPVINPHTIGSLDFDYVVIALRVAVAQNEMMEVLKEQGIPEDKVVCIFERKPPNATVNLKDDSGFHEVNTDTMHGSASMALLITGGFGDHVIQKKLICEIVKIVPQIKIDIYAIRHVDFLKYIYSDCPSVRNVIDDLGMQYAINKGKYSLAATIEACHFIKIDEFKNERIKEVSAELERRIDIIIRETKRENIDLSTPVHISNTIRLYRGLNAYSGFNYNGAFDIHDKKVSIPITADGEEYYKSLQVTAYMEQRNFIRIVRQ